MLVGCLGLCILVMIAGCFWVLCLFIGFAYGLDVLCGVIWVFTGLVFGGLVSLVFGGFW